MDGTLHLISFHEMSLERPQQWRPLPQLLPLHSTEVRFASFLPGGFTTMHSMHSAMAVINPPESKLTKHTSVYYPILFCKIQARLQSCWYYLSWRLWLDLQKLHILIYLLRAQKPHGFWSLEMDLRIWDGTFLTLFWRRVWQISKLTMPSTFTCFRKY